MARVGRGLGRSGVGLALAGLAVLAAPCDPSAAHARLVGSSPEAGATVDRAPDEVVIELDAKPATIEGDPLQVYTPDGRRVDAGDPHVGGHGRRLGVTLDPGQALPSGAYQVAYRVVSADSHVITGRLSFTVRLPSPARGAASWDGAGDPGAGRHRLIAGGPYDRRAPLVAAGALALAALALLLRAVRRRPAPRAAPTGDRSASQRPRAGQRHGPDRRRSTRHGRPPGPRARGHRLPPRTGPPRDDEAFWAGPGARRGDRRAPAPHGAPWWSAPEDGR